VTIDACIAAYGLFAALLAPQVFVRLRAIDAFPGWGVAAWLTAALSVLGSWQAASVSLVEHAGTVARGVGVALIVALGVRLIWVGLVMWWSTRSRRDRHAQAVAVLGRADVDLGVRMVDSPEPAVYCLPGGRGGLVVVTSAARSVLSPMQLQAVLAHERSHLAGRHHLLIAAGYLLSRAMPALRLFRQLGDQVARLLEMRADDAAARVYGRHTVATAIAAMGSAPSGAIGAGGPTATARVLRLIRPPEGGVRGRVELAITAFALAAGPYLATLPPCPHPW
jgi:Zn-dependent protease with chaperone function